MTLLSFFREETRMHPVESVLWAVFLTVGTIIAVMLAVMWLSPAQVHTTPTPSPTIGVLTPPLTSSPTLIP